MARQYPELGVDAATADLAIGVIPVLQAAHAEVGATLERFDGAWIDFGAVLDVTPPHTVALSHKRGEPVVGLQWSFEDLAKTDGPEIRISSEVTLPDTPHGAGIANGIRELAVPTTTLLPDEKPLLGLEKQRHGVRWRYAQDRLFGRVVEEVHPLISGATVRGRADLRVDIDRNGYAINKARRIHDSLGSILMGASTGLNANNLLEYGSDLLDADMETPDELADYLSRNSCQPYARHVEQIIYVVNWLHGITVAPSLKERTVTAS